MIKYNIFLLVVLTMVFVSCGTDEPTVIEQGDFPVKEYYIERDPKVNTWGAGFDFIHTETDLAETELDYKYLTETDSFTFDLKFYTVKAYYTASNGDLKYEGSPAILLAEGSKACKMGEGVSYFDSLTVLEKSVLTNLTSESAVDYESFKDTETGYYDRVQLFEAVDKCVIGRSFRTSVLEIPDSLTEQDIQPVFLIETADGAYVKFMVKQFKGNAPHTKQTLVRWQIISE